MRQKFCVTFKKLEGGFHCQLACRFILSIVDEYILHTLNNAHNLTKKKNRKEENPQNLYNREVTAGRKLQRPTQTISRGMFLESFTTLTCFLQLPKHIPCTHVQPVIFHANRTLWGGWRGWESDKSKCKRNQMNFSQKAHTFENVYVFVGWANTTHPHYPPAGKEKKTQFKIFKLIWHDCTDVWKGFRYPKLKKRLQRIFITCAQWIKMFSRYNCFYI